MKEAMSRTLDTPCDAILEQDSAKDAWQIKLYQLRLDGPSMLLWSCSLARLPLACHYDDLVGEKNNENASEQQQSSFLVF